MGLIFNVLRGDRRGLPLLGGLLTSGLAGALLHAAIQHVLDQSRHRRHSWPVAPDEVEEALVIPLATSSEALALADANLVISLTLSLAESIVVLMDSMLATIILFAILVPVTRLSANVAIVLIYASAIAAGKFAYGNHKFMMPFIMGVHTD